MKKMRWWMIGKKRMKERIERRNRVNTHKLKSKMDK